MGISSLQQEVILHARVIECDSDDLEVGAGIDLEQCLHEVFLGDDVEDLVHDVLPHPHFVVSLGEALAK